MTHATPATLGLSAFAPDIAGTLRIARAADEAGLDTTWTSELFNRSATIALAAMAGVTRRCKLGSAITYGVGRSPLTMNAEARDLDELSGGRFVLGLGNGTRRMISEWHGLDPDAPAVRMEELVGLLRKLWNVHQAPIDHEGRFYRLKFRPIENTPPPLSARLPIYTAGVNPRMIESAGRVADGLIAHPICSPKYLEEVVRPAVARGADHAGRAAEDVAVTSMIISVIHDDEERARDEAANQIGFYSSVKSYHGVLSAGGFGKEAAQIREAFAARDLQAMRRAVTDPMIDELAVAGTAEQVMTGLKRYDGVLDHTIIYAPTHNIAAERVEENLLSLIAMVAQSQAVV
ncbi:LLM class flavin-dependent oxidoreductase [Sporichthya sp.]|uniref:LLM class flavin-dependent oxidoreductase n=1 Tax=Sporichthya sp. TaxID=65475 RepID=UPI0017B3F8CC|nr:LLM class flavin-dependent oxidoreductase [Sporichthya sp.]MBA3741522.1 LLM class flavin-dependent oxidoreductase [Sporichthya sp.]